MITVSVTATANTVRKLSDNHDADVISWVNKLLMTIKVRHVHNLKLFKHTLSS